MCYETNKQKNERMFLYPPPAKTTRRGNKYNKNNNNNKNREEIKQLATTGEMSVRRVTPKGCVSNGLTRRDEQQHFQGHIFVLVHMKPLETLRYAEEASHHISKPQGLGLLQ